LLAKELVSAPCRCGSTQASPPQLAEWAGHSVHVLMKVYAKCVDGQEAAARHRVEGPLGLVGGQAVPLPGAAGTGARDERRREYDATSEIEGA
jgi:hypothetical protein